MVDRNLSLGLHTGVNGSKSKLVPPLKWPGGKRWQVPCLRKLLAGVEYGRLVEPFCGGLAVTLGFMPHQALLDDVNSHVVNFYKTIQRGLRIDLPLVNDEQTYYLYRDRFNALVAEEKARTSEAAVLFYYLNRTGYNGLCRFNKSGYFNVPFGRYTNITYVQDFSLYQEIFRRWTFKCKDFEKLFLRPDDLVYADPPYDVQFTQYSKDGFSWDDQVRLVEWLARHPGPVVLSNQATPRIVRLYRSHGFRLKFLQAPRRISCNGDRTPAREVLAYKNL